MDSEGDRWSQNARFQVAEVPSAVCWSLVAGLYSFSNPCCIIIIIQ